MVPLYSLMLASFAGFKWVLALRASRVEKKYTQVALRAEAVARKLQTKPGNGSADAFAVAKSQYELGRLVESRDALEAKCLKAQARADKAGRVLDGFRGWKGRLVPYALGFIDFGLALGGLHVLGLPHGLTAETIRQWAASMGV